MNCTWAQFRRLSCGQDPAASLWLPLVQEMNEGMCMSPSDYRAHSHAEGMQTSSGKCRAMPKVRMRKPAEGRCTCWMQSSCTIFASLLDNFTWSVCWMRGCERSASGLLQKARAYAACCVMLQKPLEGSWSGMLLWIPCALSACPSQSAVHCLSICLCLMICNHNGQPSGILLFKQVPAYYLRHD